MIQNLGTQEQIVLVGHSLGGAASVLATRDDPQIAGCINLDGQLFGDENVRAKGLQTPVLALYSEHIPRSVDHPGYQEEQQIFKEWDEFHATCVDSYREILKGTDHLDFTMVPLLGWVGGIDDMGGPSKEGAERAFSITSQKIISFMINLE
jgi:dienelactone hydrolase